MTIWRYWSELVRWIMRRSPSIRDEARARIAKRWPDRVADVDEWLAES